MALGTPHKIVEDTPSEVVRISRQELNKAMDALDLLITGLAGAIDIAGVNAAAAAVDMTAIRKVQAVLERPAAHAPKYP